MIFCHLRLFEVEWVLPLEAQGIVLLYSSES